MLLKQETVSCSGISWTIYKSAPRPRQVTSPGPHHSGFYRPDALAVTQPTASKHWIQRKSTTFSSYTIIMSSVMSVYFSIYLFVFTPSFEPTDLRPPWFLHMQYALRVTVAHWGLEVEVKGQVKVNVSATHTASRWLAIEQCLNVPFCTGTW